MDLKIGYVFRSHHYDAILTFQNAVNTALVTYV